MLLIGSKVSTEYGLWFLGVKLKGAQKQTLHCMVRVNNRWINPGEKGRK